MSVHNKYTGYTLKHLLLRHLYNLPLPVLMCYALKPCAATTGNNVPSMILLIMCPHTVLCSALYLACVDASRMVFCDRSLLCSLVGI